MFKKLALKYQNVSCIATVKFVLYHSHSQRFKDLHCINFWFEKEVVSLCLIYSQSLLDERNPNSCLANSQAAQLYQENRREYEKKVLVIVDELLVIF